MDIADSAGGTHYGIYSSALKTGSYAGYFLGDVAIGTTTANNYTFPASRGTNGQVMVTDTAGNLSWTTLSGLESTTASNGLSESADDIQLGGSLSQETTITFGANNLIHNLDGAGYIEVQDAGTAKFRISNTGNTRVGGDLQINQTDVTGTRLIDLTSTGTTGLVDVFSAGIRTTQIAGTGDTYFNGGSVGIGLTNPDEQLDVTDNTTGFVADFYNESTDSTADGISVRLAASSPNASAYYIGFFRGSGATVSGRISGTAAGTGIQVVTSSDVRLKTNFEEVTDALSMIQEINPKWYEFKTNLGQRELGFIAQEVKTVLPQIVTGEEDSDPNVDPMMVDYTRITPLLTAGIKELNDKVQTLEAENAQLKAQLAQYAALEARIAALEGGDKNNKSEALAVSEE
ncbi:tail fiber domain-containing protein [Gilvibacter sp.]|uniref:tail fiber domain-containing protein n=1 Tax=Gilvibacter sp. TaxID=2729997 RepID=UPI0035BE8203